MKRLNLWQLGVVLLLFAVQTMHGCAQPRADYGTEMRLSLPAKAKPQVWAVAPVLDLSGQAQVDPILQADLLFQQLQQVRGITAIPVNRVAEVYASLGITRVQSPEQAAIVCELLGCDGVLVATVTAYDPYHPPKFGASLVLFENRGSAIPAGVDPRELMRQAVPAPDEPLPGAQDAGFRQVVGIFDAANGSVREQVMLYSAGRNDPAGPMGSREYFLSMDRYCGFAYHALIDRMMGTISAR